MYKPLTLALLLVTSLAALPGCLLDGDHNYDSDDTYYTPTPYLTHVIPDGPQTSPEDDVLYPGGRIHVGSEVEPAERISLTSDDGTEYVLENPEAIASFSAFRWASSFDTPLSLPTGDYAFRVLSPDFGVGNSPWTQITIQEAVPGSLTGQLTVTWDVQWGSVNGDGRWCDEGTPGCFEGAKLSFEVAPPTPSSSGWSARYVHAQSNALGRLVSLDHTGPHEVTFGIRESAFNTEFCLALQIEDPGKRIHLNRPDVACIPPEALRGD